MLLVSQRNSKLARPKDCEIHCNNLSYLYGLFTFRAAKQLKQTNAQQLEIETKKMEERIRALKEQMMREKEERE